MPTRVVYVVAKAPRVGAVKTRLCPPLDPDQAARLYRGFLLDSLEVALGVPDATLRVMCPDPSMVPELAAMVPSACAIQAQSEPGLGSALEECFRVGLADGHQAVAVLASDNPTLPSHLVDESFERLVTNDVVIGPTEDGGYYLLAAKAVHGFLFRKMVWSTGDVLTETLRRCRAAGLRSTLTERWYDVDTVEALLELAARFESLPPDCARHTRAALRTSSVLSNLAARASASANGAVQPSVSRAGQGFT